MKLATGTRVGIGAGDYCYLVTMTSGTCSLALDIEDSAAQQITDFSFTANANGIVTLPSGYITATLTGDATLHLNIV